MGRTVDGLADLAVVTETTPHADETIEDVLLGFRAGSRVHAMPERTEAIRWMLHQAREGDCVLIAGGGSEESVVADDDREITKECLYDRVPAEVFQRAVA